MTPPSNLTRAAHSDSSLILWLLHIIVLLLQEIQVLHAKLATSPKDSTNSHGPPSSDGFKKNVAPSNAVRLAESQGDKKGIAASRVATFRPAR